MASIFTHQFRLYLLIVVICVLPSVIVLGWGIAKAYQSHELQDFLHPKTGPKDITAQ